MPDSFSLESLAPDRAGALPLHRQLYERLRRLIETAGLPPGMPLPSSRALAEDLRLGRNTVIAAYEQLALEGYLDTRPGAAPRVRALSLGSRRQKVAGEEVPRLSARGTLMASQPYHHGEPGAVAFHPGLPDVGEFPFNTWSRLLTRRAKAARADLFGTYYVTGYPDLREAIARYLTASRGVDCVAGQVVVTNGAQAAFDLLARILLDPGDTVWMEEPGYYGAASAFLAAGARLAPLRVDEDGWLLEPPPGVAPRAVFVTPSCHHPLGHTMSMGQRLDLIRLSERWGAWIVEDDYDSEYRFQGLPIPALHGAGSGERTVFVGTFAKTLFPAMRLGYMVVPPALLDRVTAALSVTGHFAPLLTQAALADFIRDGHFARHLRRTRRLYAQRRAHFFAAFDDHLSEWLELARTGSGIQQTARLLPQVDDRRIVAAAAAEGVNVSPLSMHYRHGSARQGLLLGFAAVEEKVQLRGLNRLARIMEAIAGTA